MKIYRPCTPDQTYRDIAGTRSLGVYAEALGVTNSPEARAYCAQNQFVSDFFYLSKSSSKAFHAEAAKRQNWLTTKNLTTYYMEDVLPQLRVR